MPPVFRARMAGRFVAYVVLLAASSCAAMPQPGSPARAQASATAAGGATVLAVRPIVAAALGGDGGAWRALMLDGAADSAGAPPASGVTSAEVIVRDDTGATLSIVQPAASWPRMGDRVTIARPQGAGRPTLIRLL